LIIGGDKVHRIEAQPVTPPLELWDWAACCEKSPAMAEQLLATHSDTVAKEFLDSLAAPYEPFYTPDHRPAA
jgi:hypothetical protein